MIKFQERSLRNVLHKVNFVTKGRERDIFGILVKFVHQYQFYEYWVTRS